MELPIPPRLSLALAGLTGLVLLRSLLSAIRWRKRTKGLPLPPGPKPLPLLGNILDVPGPDNNSMRCERYAEMAKQYGDMIYLQAMGQQLLIVGSSKVAFDLLEKRSANYSDRPKSMILGLIGGATMFSLASYGPKWRLQRRQFWQQLYPGMMGKYTLLQHQELHKCLQNILDEPADFKECVRDMVAAMILRAVYNIDTRGKHDPVVATLDDAISGVAAMVIPRPLTAILEYFPLLRFWPPLKREITRCKALCDVMRDLPYTEAKRRPFNMGYTCMMEAIRERLSQNEDQDPILDEETVKDVSGMAYTAGGETTFSTMQTLFLAMSLYPEVQKRAQSELDAKIGSGRLPEIDDANHLPYIRAVVKELLRWKTVTPFGVPHASVNDDEYNGYFIPAGTIIMPNIWAMLHDPAVYPDPMEFRPERFLKDGLIDPQGPDPIETFGFGRRICPGRYFAERSIFLAVASILAVFNIAPPMDDKGKPIRIKLTETDDVISHPIDCRCTVTPRSKAATALVRQSVRDDVAGMS